MMPSLLISLVFILLNAAQCYAYCPIICIGTDTCCGPYNGNYTCCDQTAQCSLLQDGVNYGCTCVSPRSVVCGKYCVPDGSCCNMPDYGGYCSGSFPYCCHNDACCDSSSDVCCSVMTGTGCCPADTVCCSEGGCCPSDTPVCACGRCYHSNHTCAEDREQSIGVAFDLKPAVARIPRSGKKSVRKL